MITNLVASRSELAKPNQLNEPPSLNNTSFGSISVEQTSNSHQLYSRLNAEIRSAIEESVRKHTGIRLHSESYTRHPTWQSSFSELGLITQEKVVGVVDEVCDALGIDLPGAVAQLNTGSSGHSDVSPPSEARSNFSVRQCAASFCSSPQDLATFLFGVEIGTSAGSSGQASAFRATLFNREQITSKLSEIIDQVISEQKEEHQGWSCISNKDGSYSFTTVLGLDSIECVDFDLMIAKVFGIEDERLLTDLYCSKREEQSESFDKPQEQDPLIPLEPLVDRIFGLLALQGRIALE